MGRILLVPDSFKGTLSSRQVCSTMKEQVELGWEHLETKRCGLS